MEIGADLQIDRLTWHGTFRVSEFPRGFDVLLLKAIPAEVSENTPQLDPTPPHGGVGVQVSSTQMALEVNGVVVWIAVLGPVFVTMVLQSRHRGIVLRLKVPDDAAGHANVSVRTLSPECFVQK